MEIITRQRAITLGLKKYFTGEPCKNGHIAERYLQSSTCEKCIRGSVASPSSPESDANRARRLQLQEERLAIEREKSDQRRQRIELAQAHAKLQEMKLAMRPKPKRSELVEIYPILHGGDVETFKSAMLLTAQMRDGSITMPELISNKMIQTYSSRARYVFKCFPLDFEDLHALAISLTNYRIASGNDADDLRRQETMRIRNEEAARLRAEEDADNGSPERLDA